MTHKKWLLVFLVLALAFIVGCPDDNDDDDSPMPIIYPQFTGTAFVVRQPTNLNLAALENFDRVYVNLEVFMNSPGYASELKARGAKKIFATWDISSTTKGLPADNPFGVKIRSLVESSYSAFVLMDKDGKTFQTVVDGKYTVEKMNLTTSCPQVSGQKYHHWISEKLCEALKSVPDLDGVLLMSLPNAMSYLSNVDADRSGTADAASVLDQGVKDAVSEMLGSIRTIMGEKFLIVGDIADPIYVKAGKMNGIHLSNFPTASYAGGELHALFTVWQGLTEQQRGESSIGVEAGNDSKIQSALAFWMLFAQGTISFGADVLDTTLQNWREKGEYVDAMFLKQGLLYYRNTKNFLVLYNAGQVAIQDLDLGGSYELNGSLVNKITIPKQQGLVLKRLASSPEKSGSFVHPELVGTLMKVTTDAGSPIKQVYVSILGQNITSDQFVMFGEQITLINVEVDRVNFSWALQSWTGAKNFNVFVNGVKLTNIVVDGQYANFRFRLDADRKIQQ